MSVNYNANRKPTTFSVEKLILSAKELAMQMSNDELKVYFNEYNRRAAGLHGSRILARLNQN